MKKAILLLLGAALSRQALPQSIQDAQHFIYYERYKSAENTLHQLIQTNPNNAEAWYWLSQAYLPLNRATALRDTLALCPADVKKDPFYQVAYGNLLLEENKKDSATWYFNQALDETKEKNVDILSAVANADITAKAGDATDAVTQLDKAIKR